MKNKYKRLRKTLFLILITLLILSTTSFGENLDISTYSPYCILIESSTGKIIYEKNSHAQVSPASTTKMMTAILALENCELTDIATVSYNAISSIPLDYVTSRIQVGEQLTIDQLLHILLIPSANDAAIVLAEHISGSVNSFVTMMNTKASEIGCLNTNFVNSNGMQAENHYSSAYDLALIGRYAMQNETFRKIVSTTSYTLPATNKYDKNDRFFKTSNELLITDTRDSVDNYYYPVATGIKTGYTATAKDCIVASAKKDGIEYIVVILGADKTENGLSARYIDCKKLFDYAFENYKTTVINEENSILKQIKISNATMNTKNLDVIVEDDITLLLKKNTLDTSITPNVEITSNLIAPISKNSVIGKITYNIDGNEYSSNLLAGADVEKSNMYTSILTISSILIVLFLLCKLLKFNKKKKRKSKKKYVKKHYR